ncbi:acyltransferase family protein [Larkinella humicola]|uniref:Acyltransferase n=1 Tax=Larkinella humicola TaxID=2607654 RepID=A0A5N1J3V9_9BACT|nr:acyltransferase [Larkinella humicola]KAA9345407.1 acyltransferase [Larkinella humicola]
MLLCSTTSLPKSFASVQALRALAALLVTIFHVSMKMEDVAIYSPFLRCFKAGFGGVDLFFVISGFIITHTNGSIMNRPDQLIPYVKKRFGRIYSIYWLVFLLAGALFLGLNAFAPSLRWLSYGLNPVEIVKALTLFPFHESLLPVTWTLSYELYFYVLFGLLIVSRYFMIIPVVLVAATVLNGLPTGQPPLFEFRYHSFLLSPFILEFCFGVGAYLLARRYVFEIHPLLMMLAAGFFFLTGEWVDPADHWLRITGFGLPATVLLLGLIRWEVANRFSYPDWLLKLGDSSYLLYLIHVPAVMILTQALMILGFSTYVVVANIVLVALLAWFSWQAHRWVEKPLLHWIYTRRPKTAVPRKAHPETIRYESVPVSVLHTQNDQVAALS